MKSKEGLYAVIGGIVGAVLTLAVCAVMPIGAQNGDATNASFESITCERFVCAKFVCGRRRRVP